MLNGDGIMLMSKTGAGAFLIVIPNLSLNATCLYLDNGLLLASVDELAGLSYTERPVITSYLLIFIILFYLK